MRRLKQLTRRGFVKGLGTVLSLAGLSKRVGAHDGTHEHEVGIARFVFDPAQVEIFVGDSITWTNSDAAPHTATAEDKTWDTGRLARSRSARITFDAPGEYPYVCAYHRHMKGIVVVRTRSNGG